jgi:hypothetical protein
MGGISELKKRYQSRTTSVKEENGDLLVVKSYLHHPLTDLDRNRTTLTVPERSSRS